MADKKEKLKVLFRLRSMETGGVQKVMTDIMNNLSQDKFELHLLLNLNQGEMLPLIPTHVKKVALADGRQEFSNNKWLEKIQLIKRRIDLLSYQLFPNKIKNKITVVPDVEIAFTSTEYNDLIHSPFKNSKKIGWFHADIRDATASDKENLELISMMKQMDKIIFVSQQTRNIIKDEYGIEFENGEVIYNPFEIERIKKLSEEFVVPNIEIPLLVSMGRLIPRKGNLLLLEAHKILIDKGMNHQIWVFGEGSEEEILREKIDNYGLQDSFIIKRPVKNPYPYIKQSTFYVLPSKSEAYPLVIGEALILGKAIVSTDAGGVMEMLEDGVNGFVVDYDAQELADKIELLLTDKNLLEKIETQNRVAYKKFDKNKVIQQIENIIDKE